MKRRGTLASLTIAILLIALMTVGILGVGCFGTSDGGTEGGATATSSASDTSSSSSRYTQIIWIAVLVAIFVAFWFFAIRPQKKQRKLQQERMASLKRGDQVMTAGGIYGTVKSLDDQAVIVEIAKGVTMKVVRRAISDIVSEKGAAKTTSTSTTTRSTARRGSSGAKSSGAIDAGSVSDAPEDKADQD